MSFVLFVQEASRRQNWVGWMEDGRDARAWGIGVDFLCPLQSQACFSARDGLPAGMGPHHTERDARWGGSRGDAPRLRCGLGAR